MIVPTGRRRMIFLVALLAMAPCGIAASGADGDDLGARARKILVDRCKKCHKSGTDGPGFRVDDRAVLLAAPPAGTDRDRYVVPGKPEESLLWQRIEDDSMPDKGPPLSSEEKGIIRGWIEKGAPESAAGRTDGSAANAFEPYRDPLVLAVIVRHLRQLPIEDRASTRYFSLANLYNNGADPDRPQTLRYARAGLSKLINSLSAQRRIVVPTPIDPKQIIYAIDLRALDWDAEGVWSEIARAYPYGLSPSESDEGTSALFAEARRATGTGLFCLRADWFLGNASRPPLYHELARIPHTVVELEQRLGVDSTSDFLRDRLARAAMIASGVSAQNRLVDRHETNLGSYWKSYDFHENTGRSNLARFPLGPNFDGNPFAEQAFRHAGGEMIFSLPNGLQGYMLADSKGDRIDKGPPDIVRDSRETSGTPEIVNALSCMACHKQGLISLPETIGAEGLAIGGDALRKARKLYPDSERLAGLIKEDRDRYLKALGEATAGMLEPGDQDEPIGWMAVRYQADLSLADVARELGLEDPGLFPQALKTSATLRELGLSPLARAGGTIKRSVWEQSRGPSAFQQTARELRLGTPIRLPKRI